MGKKKKRVSDKVFCYYCDREFDDEKILVQHQKAKHFKCHVCHKKLSTAGGMVIHVLQVHKESVSQVPNAKSGRESTDIEIYGMQGIPPDVLAAHYGEEDDDATYKVARGDNLPSQLLNGAVPRPLGVRYQPPTFGMIPSVYNPALAASPTGWTTPVHPQPWYSQPLAVSSIASMGVTQQSATSLFPLQSTDVPLPTSALPAAHLIPQISPPGLPSSLPPGLSSSLPPIPVSQPLFPILNNSNGSTQISPFLNPTSTSIPSTTDISSPLSAHTSAVVSLTVGSLSTNVQGGMPSNSHSYASGPNTGGPSIGPPPVISNRVPTGQSALNEVYLVWDDEAMSMEERRMSTLKFHVHDETSQMHSLDAAIDRRISEGRFAGRMSF